MRTSGVNCGTYRREMGCCQFKDPRPDGGRCWKQRSRDVIGVMVIIVIRCLYIYIYSCDVRYSSWRNEEDKYFCQRRSRIVGIDRRLEKELEEERAHR